MCMHRVEAMGLKPENKSFMDMAKFMWGRQQEPMPDEKVRPRPRDRNRGTFSVVHEFPLADAQMYAASFAHVFACPGDLHRR